MSNRTEEIRELRLHNAIVHATYSAFEAHGKPVETVEFYAALALHALHTLEETREKILRDLLRRPPCTK